MKSKRIISLIAALATCAVMSAQAAIVFTDSFKTNNYLLGGTVAEFQAQGWTTVINTGAGMGTGPHGGDDGILWGNGSGGEAALEYNHTNAINCGDILTISSANTRLTAYPYVREIILADDTNGLNRVTVATLAENGWGLGLYSTWFSPPAKDNIPSLRYVCQPADAGKFVIFKYGHGNNWGETADVTFDITTVTTPVFLTQLASSLERSVGEAATLSVETAGCGVTYQWKKGGVDILGETSTTLTLSALTTAATGTYTCLASNSSGTTLSSACALTVVPQIPGGASLTLGVNFSRRDGALGGGLAVASWYPSPTAPAYGLHQSRWATAVSGNNAGGPESFSFGGGSVNVDWLCNNTWSVGDVPTTVPAGNAEVNYGYLDDGGLGITVNITGLTNSGFTSYVIRTLAASDNATSFTNLMVTENDTFTSQALSYGPLSAARPGFGMAAVSSTSSTLTNDSITLNSINGGGGARGSLTGFIITDKPVMLAQPTAPTNALFTGSPFTIGASDTFGVATLAYQWQRSGTNLPGATLPSYSVGSATTNDSGSYTLIVTNNHGSVTSAPIALTVSGFFSPVINTAPQSRTAYVGGKAAFGVVASGGGLSYQWKKGTIAGTDIPNATNATLNLTGLTLSENSDYTVVVMNVVGTNSATAHLTVLPLPANTTYLGAVLADAPVSLWRLGESAGLASVDAWGLNNGVYSGTPGYSTAGLITGDADTAVTFSGDDRTEVPFSSDLNNPAGPFSVEFWTTKATVAGSQTAIGNQDRSSTRKGFYIGYNFGGFGNRWVCFMGNSANENVGLAGTTVIQPGVRYHVVVTYDGTTAKMYVNGLLEGTLARPFGVGAGFYEANTSVTTRIGARADSATGSYDGVIDDVAFYNYALTQAQVQNHAFLVAPFTVTMTPATGIVVDSKTVGLPHHGQTTTATWAATDGTRSGVMQFNPATPSVITSAVNADFNAATNGTICFWIRYNPANLSTGNEAAMIMDRRDAGSAGTGMILAVNHDGGFDDGTLFFQANPTGANPFSSTHAVNDGNWHFVAVTYGVQAGELVNIYVDNSGQVTSVPNNLTWGPWPNRQIMLGLSHDAWWKRLDGALDDFRIYTRELTPAEIDSVATTGAVVDANALVVRYDFDTAPLAGRSLSSTPFPGVLQSSTNVLGTYLDVPTGLPYLKVIPQTGNEFFRVRTP